MKEKIIKASIKAVLAIISWLPLGLARILGVVIGQCAWLLKTRSTKTAVANLKACFPHLSDKDRNVLAAKSMRHWGRTICEIPVVWRRGSASLKWVKEVQGRERLEQAMANGNGVIIVSPHLGNWEMIGYWAGTVGSLTTLYQPPRRYDLDELIRHVRSKTGATLVPTNARGVASLLKTLKRGDIIGVLPDMEPDWNSGVFAPFFGVPALTMTLIHNLVQRSGAAVFLGFAQRIGDGFRIVLIEPGAAINSDAPETSVAELNKTIETLVSMSPEQYQWEYKRFKRRPKGMAKIYQ
ncbi:MAG: lysophospholipid acyltransferase family protein [Porticoccaceae bacterium]|nr:lysophospholipid acyltransferase family protein [Porticoccaceae bacterium]